MGTEGTEVGRRCLTPFAENDENASKTPVLGTEVPVPHLMFYNVLMYGKIIDINISRTFLKIL